MGASKVNSFTAVVDVMHMDNMLRWARTDNGHSFFSARDELENLITMSERACHVRSALDRPPESTLTVEVDGEPF